MMVDHLEKMEIPHLDYQMAKYSHKATDIVSTLIHHEAEAIKLSLKQVELECFKSIDQKIDLHLLTIANKSNDNTPCLLH